MPVETICLAMILAAGPAQDSYPELLRRYVTPEGIRYDAWRAAASDVKALSDVVADLSRVDPAALSDADRVALYINLYNAKVLEIVVNGNPGKSIKDLSGGINPYEIFTRKALDLGGQRISLLNLENRLREESGDPRIHFAVNCASRSCPPISPEVYRGETLDAQLDRVSRSFLASPGTIVVTGEKTWLGRPVVRISISRIFKWYAKDFEAGGGIVAFLERYGTPAVVSKIRSSRDQVKLAYQKYDWRLNAAP